MDADTTSILRELCRAAGRVRETLHARSLARTGVPEAGEDVLRETEGQKEEEATTTGGDDLQSRIMGLTTIVAIVASFFGQRDLDDYAEDVR